IGAAGSGGGLMTCLPRLQRLPLSPPERRLTTLGRWRSCQSPTFCQDAFGPAYASHQAFRSHHSSSTMCGCSAQQVGSSLSGNRRYTASSHGDSESTIPAASGKSEVVSHDGNASACSCCSVVPPCGELGSDLAA